MKKGIIISARGLGSFTRAQVEQISANLNATFHPQLDELESRQFVELCQMAEIVALTRRTVKNLNREMIESLPWLKGVVIFATGYDWVDLQCLRERKIVLSYLPDYATTAVAEHTIALMLAMSRRIHLSFDRVRAIVDSSVSLRGWELRGKTLGIIGYGRIGQEVARLAAAFGMEVRYYDHRGPIKDSTGFLPLLELLKKADVLALTASRVKGAAPLLTDAELHAVKEGVYIINTSRSYLVEHIAVLKAIKSKRVSGYAVDDKIELFLQEADIEPGRILQTGHTAWYSNEAIARGTQTWVDNIVALAIGKPINVVCE